MTVARAMAVAAAPPRRLGGRSEENAFLKSSKTRTRCHRRWSLRSFFFPTAIAVGSGDGSRLDAAGTKPGETFSLGSEACLVPLQGNTHRPIVYQTKPLPSVLILHTGGTLGMSSLALETRDDLLGAVVFKEGTGGDYTTPLQPSNLLLNLVTVVPELRTFANLEVKVLMNKDSCQIGPHEWVQIATELDEQRGKFDAFIVVHGTDTLAYTASALSLMLAGFKKPIIVTGSQLPLDMPRSDARQNLIDAVTWYALHFPNPDTLFYRSW
jgi:hypothetical protein